MKADTYQPVMNARIAYEEISDLIEKKFIIRPEFTSVDDKTFEVSYKPGVFMPSIAVRFQAGLRWIPKASGLIFTRSDSSSLKKCRNMLNYQTLCLRSMRSISLSRWEYNAKVRCL